MRQEFKTCQYLSKAMCSTVDNFTTNIYSSAIYNLQKNKNFRLGRQVGILKTKKILIRPRKHYNLTML